MSITGKVRWFKNDRAYGFLVADDGQEFFVHAKDVRKAGLQTLEAGQHVEFDLYPNTKNGRPAATNIKLLEQQETTATDDALGALAWERKSET
jgi:cold shock protein